MLSDDRLWEAPSAALVDPDYESKLRARGEALDRVIESYAVAFDGSAEGEQAPA